jgi:multiple sugar transport system ATP-binding protein
MAEVALRSVSKSFGKVRAVEDISLEIGDGEFVVLLGPTGVGKTTTLRLVAGLEAPDRGSIEIDGRDVTKAPPAARDVAFVFQQYSLYPHLSVYDNLAFPLRSPLRAMAEEQIRARVNEIARLLRIEDKLANAATRLSGGQMQRVAIGRALVRKPAVFLMDEPLSSLDAKLRSELRLELKHIQQDLGATILYVTHDQIEAMTMANRIGVMQAGRLVQIGTPREIYETPASTYVATRLGNPAINLVPRSAFPDVAVPPGTVSLGARTENIRLTRANGGVGGRIRWIEHLGDQNHLHIEMGAHSLVTLVDPEAPLDVGTEVAVELVRPLCFDADGNRIRA